MALPTTTDLLTIDYSYLGVPFVDVPAKSTIDTATMDYSHLGVPFVTNPAGTPPVTTNIKSYNFTAYAGIKKAIGVPTASVKTINGVS